jgi:hypothetical protein
VNLYVPSRLTWIHGSTHVTLTQSTEYPHRAESQIEVTADAPVTFPVFLRIPAWAGPGTAIAVNGKRVLASPEPGKFARLDRTWTNGDRIEIAFDMPTVLQAVDSQHPDLQALVHGPLALFSVGAVPARLEKKELLAVEQVSAGSTSWQAKIAASPLTLRPFAALDDEIYRLYLNVAS